MAIKETNGSNGNSNAGNRNQFKPSHTWDVMLPCGNAVFTPANKLVDSVESPDSICNMLLNCHGIVKNKAENFTVYFKHSNGAIRTTGFIGGCKDLTEEEIVVQFNELKHGDVTVPMTAEEMEAEWNQA